MNFYIHRTGGMIDDAELKRHSTPHPQSRLFIKNAVNRAVTNLPDSFDSRTDPRWTECQDVISEIQVCVS